MSIPTIEKPKYQIKTPKNLSPRIQWLRDYYFQGVKRKWNNEFTAWTTGTPWDFQYHELTFYIVPETYFFLPTFRSSFKQAARPVALPAGFLGLEHCRTAGLVRQRGDGRLSAAGDAARRPDRRARASTSRPPPA